MTMNSKIKTILINNDISILGIGDADFLNNNIEGHRPCDLLEGAKRVVVIAKPIPRGVYKVKNRLIEMTWRTHNLYYRNLDTTILSICNMVESGGFIATPIFGCYPMEMKKKNDIWGYVSLINMAVASGVGSIGKNGMLFTKKYGSRLMLGGLITTAPLEFETWPEKDEAQCPEDCYICQEECPVNAISKDGSVDRVACTEYSSRTPVFINVLKSLKKECDQKKVQMLMNITSADENNMNTCTNCISKCPLI